MVAKGTGRRMRGYDRFAADCQCIIETFLSGMRNIYHHSHTVHFFYHLFTECAYAQSFLIITGRAADIIISVVAKCHVHHATMAETFYIRDILANGISVSMPSMTAFSLLFQTAQISGSICYIYGCTVLGNHLLYFVQDAVCFGSSGR